MGVGFGGMKCLVNPLVLSAKLRQTRARGGSRGMEWLLQHHL
jgi:hypothetical protein